MKRQHTILRTKSQNVAKDPNLSYYIVEYIYIKKTFFFLGKKENQNAKRILQGYVNI